MKTASLENIPAQFGFDRIQRHPDRNGRNQIKNESNDGEQSPDPRISSRDARRPAYGLMHQCLCLNYASARQPNARAVSAANVHACWRTVDTSFRGPSGRNESQPSPRMRAHNLGRPDRSQLGNFFIARGGFIITFDAA